MHPLEFFVFKTRRCRKIGNDPLNDRRGNVKPQGGCFDGFAGCLSSSFSRLGHCDESDRRFDGDRQTVPLQTFPSVAPLVTVEDQKSVV